MSDHTPGPWSATGTKAFGLSEVVAPDQDHPRHYILDGRDAADAIARARAVISRALEGDPCP